LIQGDASGVTPNDNANIPTKSDIAMYKVASEEAALTEDVALMDHSGIDFGQGIKYSKFGMPYYLLTAGSDVTKLGDPALLAGYDSNADLFNQTRPIAADGSITAAPTNASVGDDYNDSGWEAAIPPVGTGIGSVVTPAAKQGITVITTIVSNGILGVDFGELKGLAKGELISVNGQVVENVFNSYVVGKGYYNVHTTTPGVYVLRVTIDGKSYATRLIVK
jgi:hypothetical protein